MTIDTRHDIAWITGGRVQIVSPPALSGTVWRWSLTWGEGDRWAWVYWTQVEG